MWLVAAALAAALAASGVMLWVRVMLTAKEAPLAVDCITIKLVVIMPVGAAADAVSGVGVLLASGAGSVSLVSVSGKSESTWVLMTSSWKLSSSASLKPSENFSRP